MAAEINYQEIAEKLNQKIYDRNSYWFYGQIKPLMPALSKIVKSNDIEKVEFEKIDMDLAHMQTLVLDFLYDLDPSLEEKALDVLEDLEHTVLFVSKPHEDAKGNSVGLRDLKGKNGRPLKNSPRVEIRLHPKNDTMGIVVVGHEYAHILSQRIQERKLPKTDCVGEIEGVFFERIFADWLLKNKKISKSEREKMDIAWKDNFIKSVQVICEEFDLLNRLEKPTNAEDLQRVEKQLEDEKRFGWLEILKRRIDIMINSVYEIFHGEREFRYVVAEIVANALYEDYKKEPKKTIERFKEFLSHNADYEFFKKKKVEKDGKKVENFVIDKKEVDDCFSTLLGNDYKSKLSKAIKSYEKEKTA